MHGPWTISDINDISSHGLHQHALPCHSVLATFSLPMPFGRHERRAEHLWSRAPWSVEKVKPINGMCQLNFATELWLPCPDFSNAKLPIYYFLLGRKKTNYNYIVPRCGTAYHWPLVNSACCWAGPVSVDLSWSHPLPMSTQDIAWNSLKFMGVVRRWNPWRNAGKSRQGANQSSYS